MRAIKTSIISILAIGLLAGSAVGVAAQEEEAAAEPAVGSSYFTGVFHHGGANSGQPTETVVDGVMEVRGWGFEGNGIETSDPRMTGSVTRNGNTDIHKLGDSEDVGFEAVAWRIKNDDGSWSGQGSTLTRGGRDVPRDEATYFETIVLTGEGAYEGLTAYVLVDWTALPIAVEGAIFVGEAPPLPEAAPAE